VDAVAAAAATTVASPAALTVAVVAALDTQTMAAKLFASVATAFTALSSGFFCLN
jgi:hypothetical protein